MPQMTNAAGWADSYLVCATPRTGSSLLCGLLASTGIAGCPEAYFRQPDERSWARQWRITDGSGVFRYQDYVRAALAAGRTANGVFGAKVMWGTLEEVVAKLAAVHPSLADADLDLLNRELGRTRFVFLRRADIVAQAVSWLRAEQTNLWCAGRPEPSGDEPRFDFDGIHDLVRLIEEHNTGWREWFASFGIRPHPVVYEELVADMAGTTRGVLDFLGLPAGAAIAPRHRRQADELNAEWIDRYRAKVAKRRHRPA
ncbi:Stf0 family sulfotransferase [Allosalinactinospora lopnorensis]|uniref:Stf0 family sulfotransferase n=1 Tax=Allosalinactinospora lopnorensis TaxID=1352348 RepID=UPI000623FA70|nr:Stf0 family sulfotransferase [Allosalinactinospora lopnorensis]